MRSSIACTRCRRSKVKCVNNGINTTCRDCEAKGRECTYPIPASSGPPTPSRQDGSGVRLSTDFTPHGEAPRRNKVKKPSSLASTNVSTRESMRAMIDALDPTLLTPRVWTELFEIYQLHFAVDLPYLHAPTFLRPLRQATSTGFQQQEFGHFPERGAPATLPDAPPVLLLAFLALTAKLHPQIVAHHSPASGNRPSNPLIASEYYASACRARLAGNMGDGLGNPQLTRVQALLMLALHEWSLCQGVKSFISVGVAIRYAQMTGLQYQSDIDDEPISLSTPLQPPILVAQSPVPGGVQIPRSVTDEGDVIVKAEIRRRTFWASFLMDRFVSNGKFRPQMIRLESVHVQLPCSDRAFLFGDLVSTATLDRDGMPRALPRTPAQSHRFSTSSAGISQSEFMESKEARQEIGADESMLSRYVRAVELYGQVMQWSCAGGRQTDRYPPTDPQSHWRHLHSQVQAMKIRLPRDLSLGQSNLSAHASSRTSTPYTLLHLTLLLCNILLHREFLPFVPMDSSKPLGPLEEPMYPPEQVHPSFWETSAEELFRSARQVVDLVNACKELDVLVRTPLVAFTVYNVAILGVYSNHFPWMDREGQLSESKVQPSDGRGVQAAQKSIEILGDFCRFTRLADGFVKTILKANRYFKKMKREYHGKNSPIASTKGQWPFRDSQHGSTTEETMSLDVTLLEFANLEEEDVEMADIPEPDVNRAPSTTASQSASLVSRSESARIQSASGDEAMSRPDSWNAINTAAALGGGPTEPQSARYGSHQLPPITSGKSVDVVGRSERQHSLPHHSIGMSSQGSSMMQGHQQPAMSRYSDPERTKQGMSADSALFHRQGFPSPSFSHPRPPVGLAQQDSQPSNYRQSFSGADVAAFAEGREPTSTARGDWLSVIWASGSPRG